MKVAAAEKLQDLIQANQCTVTLLCLYHTLFHLMTPILHETCFANNCNIMYICTVQSKLMAFRGDLFLRFYSALATAPTYTLAKGTSVHHRIIHDIFTHLHVEPQFH